MTMTLKDTVAEDAALEVAEFTPAARKPEPKPVDVGSINTLHELLAVAIGDFEKVLRNPSYGINIGSHWHQPLANDRCSVCLAGSVMAMSLHGRRDACIDVYDMQWGAERNTYPEPLVRRLLALNDLRLGDVADAAARLSLMHEDAVDRLDRKWSKKVRCSAARTRQHGYTFLREMRRLHADLAEAGI